MEPMTTYTCSHCAISMLKKLVCGKCGVPRYCGKKCQQEAWPSHKKTCIKPAFTASQYNQAKRQESREFLDAILATQSSFRKMEISIAFPMADGTCVRIKDNEQLGFPLDQLGKDFSFNVLDLTNPLAMGQFRVTADLFLTGAMIIEHVFEPEFVARIKNDINAEVRFELMLVSAAKSGNKDAAKRLKALLMNRVLLANANWYTGEAVACCLEYDQWSRMTPNVIGEHSHLPVEHVQFLFYLPPPGNMPLQRQALSDAVDKMQMRLFGI